MDNSEKTDWIDKLLVYINEDIENTGRPINQVRFDFNDKGDDSNIFIKKYQLEYGILEEIVKTCISRNYLKQTFAYALDGLQLTESGQGRAISVMNAKDLDTPEKTGVTYIGTVNSSGPTQIGNNNTQLIENVFLSLIKQIDESEAPDGDKKEAKGRLKKFITHPLVNTVLGASIGAVTTLLGG